MIELPEFVTGQVVERTYQRALTLQDLGRRGDARARRWLVEGMNRAKARDPRMAAFLEYGAEHLRKLNDAQVSRFEQEGFRKTEYTEFGAWREAYLKMTDHAQDESIMYRVFGWVYAAVAEALVRGG